MEFAYLDSATQARLENKVAALCNKYLPEIVAKFNAFDGKILTTDGKRTKAAEAAFPYWYAREELAQGEQVRLSIKGNFFDHIKTGYAHAEFHIEEYAEGATLQSREIYYCVGEVKDGYRNDARTGWKHDGTKERTDWTAQEIDALKGEYEKAKRALDDAKDKARNFIR